MRRNVEVKPVDFIGVIKLFWFVLTNLRGSYEIITFIWSWMNSNEFREISKVLPDPYIMDY